MTPTTPDWYGLIPVAGLTLFIWILAFLDWLGRRHPKTKPPR